jgi:WD40 repeat protein
MRSFSSIDGVFDVNRSTNSSDSNNNAAASSIHQMIYELLLERNQCETLPFLAIHESNARLLNQVDALQTKLENAEREISSLRQELLDGGGGGAGGGVLSSEGAVSTSSTTSSKVTAAAARAAIKNEARLRDKLEALQEELNAKLRSDSERQATILKATQDLSKMKDLNTALERTISNLKDENGRSERAIVHLTNEVSDAKSRTDLAEKQYEGLKRTIRKLQDENDKLSKENRTLEGRLLADKGKTVEEMNALTDLVNALKMEVDMLRSYKIQEEKRRSSWFGGVGSLPNASPSPPNHKKKSAVGGAAISSEDEGKESARNSRKWGSFGVVLPSSPKHSVVAHTGEGTCLRYDDSGADLVATAGSDSCVKVFETGTGACRATLRGTPGHAIIGCDVSGGLVAGGGSDKTCRVWNLRTERMVRSRFLPCL